MENISIDTTLKSLEQKYLEGNFEGLAEGLLKIKPQLSDGVFHYNLGTTYLKNNQLPAARLQFEKAITEGNISSPVLKNLNTVKTRINSNNIEQSKHIFDNYLSYSYSVPKEAYTSFALFFTFIFLILYRFKIIKTLGLSLGLLLALGFVGQSIITSKFYQRAILMESTNIYEGPSKSFDISTEMSGGVRVILDKKNEKWLYVKSPVHLSGWVERSKLGFY